MGGSRGTDGPTGGLRAPGPGSNPVKSPEVEVPGWFGDFLTDRATRKPSVQTLRAYRQDFAAIAATVSGGTPADMTLADITRDKMRSAFAVYAASREPATIRRCWSTWNVLCEFLYTADLIAANPMSSVGRPKAAKTVPRALPRSAVVALLKAISGEGARPRVTDWPERDLVLVLLGLLAGLRADELRKADVGDIRLSPATGAAVIHVRGKGGKDRAVPVEADLVAVIDDYLDSRANRFPVAAGEGRGLSRWPALSPLLVGCDGERITRGTVQSRVRRAFRRAGPDAQPVQGALVHGLRHTYATELANSNVSVYTLMRLLGHESMATSQRYVSGAAHETRAAAAQNPLYATIRDLGDF